MILSIEHHLGFEYDGYISESFLELRVQPKACPHQTLNAFSLAVGPPSRVHRYTDWNDNAVHHFNVTRYHDRIEVLSRSVVTTHPAGPALDAITDPASPVEVSYVLRDFLAFGGPVQLTPDLREFQRALPRVEADTLGDLVRSVGGHVHRGFTYRKDVTRYDSTTEDFLRLGAGVCQDFSHLMLGTLRLLRIPCRYVSGYLHVTAPAPGADAPVGRADAPVGPAQSHAWIEFWSPTHGWVAFDPTHDREIDECYVILGHGRDYNDVPPNKGIYRGNAHESLRAEVRTRVTSERKASAHESVEAIDVPVFTETPERRTDYDTVILLDQAAQQQQ
jgi:transglutaminase-like putative cysteine protease